MNKGIFIEITIPVLNEEKTLEQKVLELTTFLDSKDLVNFSVVIADNGSTDKTEEIGKRLSLESSVIKYINVGRKGVGLALKQSWKESKADIVAYIDLDLSTDLNHIVQVYELFCKDENLDIVTGSRLMKESVVKNRKVIRTITSVIYNTLCARLTRTKLSDYTCGFKFLKRDVFKELTKNDELEDGWFFTSEILIKAIYYKLNLLELPVKWIDDPESSISIASLSLYYLKQIFKLRREYL